MEINDMKYTLKKQLHGKYFSLAGILFLTTLCTSALNLVFSFDFLMTHSFWYPIYLFAMLFFIVVRNTVYFLFIKCVRAERFTKADLSYSVRKSGLHILTALLFEILQLGLLLLVQYIQALIPIIGIVLILMVQVVLSAVSLFIAFAIYDGVKGAMNIVNNSFRLLFFKLKDIIRFSVPFFIWMLIYQFVNQYLVSHMVIKNTDTVIDVLTNALQSETTAMYAYGYIGLEVLHLLISCCILVPLYTVYANLYEADYVHFYPFSSVIQTNVIDIDYEEKNDC